MIVAPLHPRKKNRSEWRNGLNYSINGACSLFHYPHCITEGKLLITDEVRTTFLALIGIHLGDMDEKDGAYKIITRGALLDFL